MSDEKQGLPQFSMDTSDNQAPPFTQPDAFSQYPGSSNPPPPSYSQQYPPNPQYAGPPGSVPQPQQPYPSQYPPAPGISPYPPQAYYGPPPPGQQQQQQQNVVVIGDQSPNVIVQPRSYVNTQTAIILACVVFWFCGWMCGLIAYMIAGELVQGFHSSMKTRPITARESERMNPWHSLLCRPIRNRSVE